MSFPKKVPSAGSPRLRRASVAAVTAIGAVAALHAVAAPEWLEHAIAGTPVEAALYRAMALPGVEILFPRPPKESVAELDKLIAAKPAAALYSLRARQEEQALEFDRAEADWKTYVAKSSEDPAAQGELADFYERRHDEKAEFATRLTLASAPATHADLVTSPASQRSWQAFERARQIALEQDFDDAAMRELWDHWAARYPQEPSVYQRAFVWELDHGHAPQAQAWVQRYTAAFPHELVFPVKARALLALRGGGPDAQERAIAVYDQAFQPLWPQDLLKSYFALLDNMHRKRSFLSQANARLQARPGDYEAAARVFVYYREQGRKQQASDALEAYRAGKEQRHEAWKPDELFTFAQLARSVQDYATVVRYDFALAQTPGTLASGRTAHEAGLAGMIDALLTAPDANSPLGSGNLSMYRDIATLDRGPGYWNGVLSLWLNGTSPSSEYAQEDAKAQPYFHRAKAAELLAQLDHDAPQSPDRAALHAKLLTAYEGYGDDAAVIREGTAFLDAFPHAGERLNVAFSLADAYARKNDTTAEFALYDRLLRELAPETKGTPLTLASAQPSQSNPQPGADAPQDATSPDEDAPQDTEHSGSRPKVEDLPAFALNPGSPQMPENPAAEAYSRVLERYLARLTQRKELPEALIVLRHELDRNPDDPAIYDRLAQFLEANNLSAQTEELYRSALAHFHGGDWYSKLARFYLRHRRNNDYATLTREVTRIFSGTELDAWFRTTSGGGSQLALQLNLYAHQRFPHDTVFLNNLLRAYALPPTRNNVAWEALMRQCWWESPELTQQYFAHLSETGQLDAEVAKLGDGSANPATQRELATAEMWSSHFERSAPLFVSLAQLYPADTTIGTNAADLERSLAWLDPAGPQARIASAVAIENHLLAANPGDEPRLERIGDILADHADGSPESYAASAAYWRRIPRLAPGTSESYLSAATVFWDYFQFDDALAQIASAREHLASPTLFAYEAGAIDEGKLDMAAAIDEYVRGAQDPKLDEDSDNPAKARLLTLAHRPATAKLVDAATASALASHADVRTLRLRVAVLEEQQHQGEVPPLLLAAVARAKTEEEAGDIAAYAASHNQAAIREAALDKQATLATDPVQRLELRYELASAYEGSGDLAAATRIIDATYRDNPKLLGVVRATVDFDWRTKRQQEAVRVLVEAAHAAQPALADQLLAEASQKANTAGDGQQARSLAEQLLAKNPYDARDLSLVAATYSNDAPGLTAFYQQRLDALKTASMTAEERKQRTALLRRGLIPVLTQSSNYAGAVDQYIALLSAYPEDTALVNEAALYALRYDRKQQWLDFLATTTKSSPRDSRFFVALALSQQLFNDPAAAADAYAHAIAIRKDRADWYQAKAGLDDALGHLEDEVADDTRLYQLSFQDPQWMVAVASTRARQGRSDDAVAALEKAYLHGSQSTPHDYLAVAAQLEQWNYIPQARHYAELGAKAAGTGLLLAEGRRVQDGDAAAYARILVRAHAADVAMATLQASLADAAAPSAVNALLAQVKQQGPLAVTDNAWRARFIAMRQQQAGQAFAAALQAMCHTVDLYATPEDRARFASLLDAQARGASDEHLRSWWIPAAETAQLPELEERWRTGLLMAAGQRGNDQLQPILQLQHARMLLAALRQTLDAYVASRSKASDGNGARDEIFRISVETGDVDGLLRLVHQQMAFLESDAGTQQLVLDEIISHAPKELVTFAASHNEALADRATDSAIASAPLPIALEAIIARGGRISPVWTAQYHALAGLYDRDASQTTGAAFHAALALDQTIGQRVAAKPDPAQQLVGAVWFYGAARYGQWLSLPGQRGDAEETMAADLEQAATLENYRELATSYDEAGRTDAALGELRHAMELAPDSASLEDASAVLLWKSNRKPEAIAAWTRSYADLRSLEDSGGAVPESFWSDFASITRHTASRSLTQPLETAREDVLRVYLARNGAYRSNELLAAEFAAWPDPKAGVSHVLTLAANSKDEFEVLGDIDSASWLPASSQVAVLERELQLLHNAASDPSRATQMENWSYRRGSLQNHLLSLYLNAGDTAKARALLASMTDAERAQPETQKATVLIAARQGELSTLLASYSASPGQAPSTETLEGAAAQLSSEKQYPAARQLLEFVFARAQSEHALEAKDYLALAEARLHAGDTPGAVAVLQQMTQQGTDRTTRLDSAAALLEKNGLPQEAIAFLTQLSSAAPWEVSVTVRLAEAKNKVHAGDGVAALKAVASNGDAPYLLRVRAARDLRGAAAPAHSLGSGELDVLAAGSQDASAAGQPYFALARAAVADRTSDAATKLRLLREAIAIAPYGSESETMRSQLFLAAYDAKQMTDARMILDEWTAARGHARSSSAWNSAGGSDESAIGDNTTSAQGEDPHVLDAMAAVYLATGDRAQAINALQREAAAMGDTAPAKKVRQQAAQLLALARRDAANAVRRPMIHAELAQPHVVRARLESPPEDDATGKVQEDQP